MQNFDIQHIKESSVTLERPKVVLFIGPPGAGKGTHAGPLAEWLGVPHISTGALFRDNIDRRTSLGQKAKAFLDVGTLVPDDIVLDMVFARLSQPDCKQGYILDGFPRTVVQARALEPLLRHCRFIVVHLDVPDAVLIDRISGRLVCACGRAYHKRFSPPAIPGICDGCKGALFQRDDDREETVKKRLAVYREQTVPLIAYYDKWPGVLQQVDGRYSRDTVFDLILKVTGASSS